MLQCLLLFILMSYYFNYSPFLHNIMLLIGISAKIFNVEGALPEEFNILTLKVLK